MVIKVENLVKVYGPIRAVDGISFEVNKGEVFGMLGPNGAGKTTTVEIIEGLRTQDSGKVTVLGLDSQKATKEIKQRIGAQLQTPSLMPSLTVEELLEVFAGFYDKSLPTEELLEIVSLKESRRVLVKNLSGGQLQRLSVAMALVNDPEITFLDEPTTGLDPQVRRSMWQVIEDMKAKGKTVFLTTHYMEEAERLCDRIAIVDHGKIIALDTPRGLINSNFKEQAIQFELDPRPSDDILLSFPGATSVATDLNEVVVYTKDVPATMSAAIKYAEMNCSPPQLKDLRVRQASLEDVFLKLTGRKIRE
ncbi:ABC-2 type transport system ATP-binding protein [Dehalogenimonas formicexedens]|uniref:ABC-2 type transport system ATP-binding protein n=1 Tax=Dehalogenimonas formicexedens TaxID=1839801 RepID=A0A1P8F7A4_9CHLR|nr:ABC transporter ATP-binding protein [Dehalogenimonas formicexedens]APV44340.1 ABC-2 type transport system ATP-binding protein [Dehalogenimonas formicexedens]